MGPMTTIVISLKQPFTDFISPSYSDELMHKTATKATQADHACKWLSIRSVRTTLTQYAAIAAS